MGSVGTSGGRMSGQSQNPTSAACSRHSTIIWVNRIHPIICMPLPYYYNLQDAIPCILIIWGGGGGGGGMWAVCIYTSPAASSCKQCNLVV